jgi:hypothetical protein
MHILLSFLTTFLIYSVSGFVVFYFGSKPTERELDRREALMSALVLGVTATATAFLGTFYGPALTFFLVVSMLARVYDCGLWSSIFMTVAAQLFPFGLFMLWRTVMGG